MRPPAGSLGAHGKDYSGRAVGVLLVILAVSCHHKAPERQLANGGLAESVLERCVRASGYKVEGHPGAASPSATAAARACFAKYVRPPTGQRWATQISRNITKSVLQEGERIYIEVLRECAERKGVAIDVQTSAGHSTLIMPRDQSGDGAQESRDRAFIACAEAAETSERNRLESGEQSQ